MTEINGPAANDETAARLRRFNECKLAAANLPLSDRRLEPKLHGLRWFEYRFMTPTAATTLFRKMYDLVYARKACGISAEVGFVEGNLSKLFPRRADLTSFWRARQLADQLGMPYEIFLDAAFDVLFATASRRRKPRVNQIYSDKNRAKVIETANSYWQRHRGSCLTYSHLPHYRHESFDCHPEQIAHQKWVLGELRAHSTPEAIGEACFLSRVISEERALAEFGEELLSQARDVAAGRPRAPRELSKSWQELPSCHGLPGAFDGSSVACIQCREFGSCAKAAKIIADWSLKETKFKDRDDLAKSRQRLRTRKCRFKKRFGQSFQDVMTKLNSEKHSESP